MREKFAKKLLIFVGMTALVCIALLFPTIKAGAQEKQKIRVAYFSMGDYYTKEKNGVVKSYDTDYLTKISDYTGIEMEYVDCGTWANALEMLEEKKVDLVGTAQWSAEREKKYEYCLEAYAYTVGELAALPEKKLVYEDYDTIGNSVIGCVENYIRREEMEQIFEKNNIHPKMKYYETQEALESALERKEIDLIAANSHTLKSSWTVAEKFSYAPFYFISWKGNTSLTDKIDDAIIRINLQESEYDDELMKEYFPNLTGAPLTKEELELIAKNKTYTIYYNSNVKPLAWYDIKSRTMQGALIDACSQIKESTGLNITVRPNDEKPKTQATTIQFTTLFYDSNANKEQEDEITNSMLDEPFNLFHRVGESYDMEHESYTIAIVQNRKNLKEYLKEKYPNCTVVSYETPKDCILHIENGEADLAFLNVHVAETAMMQAAIENIREIPMDDIELGIGMYVQGEDQALVESIIDKGINHLDQAKISNAMLQYALETTPEITFSVYLKDHKTELIILCVLLLIVITSLLTYAGVMRHQRDKIEQADKDRTEFFARMSHDMRTPMNGILGMIELTKESSNLKDIHTNMKKAKSSGEYMLNLINDTLDLQRLETGRMQLTPQIIYAKTYFENIFSMMRVSAEKKKIDFVIENKNVGLEKYIKIDPVRVKQIFTNLLSNAIKFTPESGIVHVTMECLGEEGIISHKKFIVEDSGIGMSTEFIEKNLYRPYAQEHNDMTNQYAGSGLGLAITKNLVEMMGGHIEVQSELGEGTVFTFYIDFENVSEEEAKKEEKKKKQINTKVEAKLEGKRVLLCEDHPLNAEIAKRILEKAGCIVTWQDNGEKGVTCYEESTNHYFDVILMDIKMPVMNGLEATRAIRALERSDAKQVPILAMTANAYDSDIAQSMDAGMNEHLAKPVNPKELYAAIAKYL